MSIDKIDDKIYELATDRQKEYIDAVREHGTNEAAGKVLGVNESSVRRAVNSAIRRAEKRYVKGLPEMFVGETKKLGKITTHIKDGVVKNVWYRQDDDKEVEAIKDAIKAFCEEQPKIESKSPEGMIDYDKDIIPWFNIGDCHIGMLAYKNETGENFDLKIGERDLCAAMKILIDESPNCERCVIQDLGDMTHYENEIGKTEGHGHDLDCDGRYYKMIYCYARIMRFIISSALDKFKYVDIIVNQGNHSRKNDFWMNVLLNNVYENEPRINVLNNENVFIPYRMGNTFVMCHHSDKCKPARLADVMSVDYRHDFGEALYKYVDIGHIHHHMVSKEHPSVVIESFNQLAVSDKYAHDGGWRSRSSLTVIYRSKTYGEIGRQRLPLERVRDILENVKAGTNSNKRQKVYTV